MCSSVIYGCSVIDYNRNTETCVGKIKKECEARIPPSRTISEFSAIPSTIPPPPPLPLPIIRPQGKNERDNLKSHFKILNRKTYFKKLLVHNTE